MVKRNYSWLDQLKDTTIDFEKYIKTFSTATYTIEFSNRQPIVATIKNLFEKLDLIDDFKQRGTAFFVHNVTDGELPEDVSKRFYGTIDFWWVILVFNQITNPFTQWPMKDEALQYLSDEYLRIENKYPRDIYYSLLFEQNEKLRKLDILKPRQLQDLIFQYKNSVVADDSLNVINKQFTITL